MKTFRKIGSLILLAIFLFGITGLSVFRHHCFSSGTETVALYTGIFTTTPESCCSDEPVSGTAGDQEEKPLSWEEQECCKSVTSFLVLKFFSEIREMSIVLPMSAPADCYIPSETDIWKKEILTGSIRELFHPPPLSGRLLLIFIHQVKIPATPDFS